MTMTLDELKEAVADICAGCDSERSLFTNADLGDAIDAAIRERDELRAGRDAWAEQHASRVLELVAARERAVKAQAELAALKARIARAPVAYLTSKTGVGPCNVASMAHGVVFDSSSYGKSVRVVLDE